MYAFNIQHVKTFTNTIFFHYRRNITNTYVTMAIETSSTKYTKKLQRLDHGFLALVIREICLCRNNVLPQVYSSIELSIIIELYRTGIRLLRFRVL